MAATDSKPRRDSVRAWFPRDERGITMVEIIISVIILTIFVLAAGSVFLANQNAFARGRDKLLMQQNVTLAQEYLSRTLRYARSVTLAGGSTDLSAYDADGNLLQRYYLSGTQFLTQAPSGGPKPILPEKVNTLTFSLNADTTIVSYTFEAEDRSFNKVAIGSSAKLRNHWNQDKRDYR